MEPQPIHRGVGQLELAPRGGPCAEERLFLFAKSLLSPGDPQPRYSWPLVSGTCQVRLFGPHVSAPPLRSTKHIGCDRWPAPTISKLPREAMAGAPSQPTMSLPVSCIRSCSCYHAFEARYGLSQDEPA